MREEENDREGRRREDWPKGNKFAPFPTIFTMNCPLDAPIPFSTFWSLRWSHFSTPQATAGPLELGQGGGRFVEANPSATFPPYFLRRSAGRWSSFVCANLGARIFMDWHRLAEGIGIEWI